MRRRMGITRKRRDVVGRRSVAGRRRLLELEVLREGEGLLELEILWKGGGLLELEVSKRYNINNISN